MGSSSSDVVQTDLRSVLLRFSYRLGSHVTSQGQLKSQDVSEGLQDFNADRPVCFVDGVGGKHICQLWTEPC